VHYGGVLSPFNAWLIMRGAATLPLRMRVHEENALAVAEFLEGHKRVKRVIYPGLASHPQYELARKQMRNFSGMLTFQPEGDGAEIARRMIERFEVIHYAVSLGHHRSLIYWIPTDALMASSFKLAGDALERYRAFAGDGVFRFSVGIEDAQDICADLERALA
jgi:cystathionine beta-lyase/cystathionine gamma-synthase